MSDINKIRISVVINRDLDPDAFEILSSIESPRMRSELARRLLTAGAESEIGRIKKSSKKADKPKKEYPPEAKSTQEIQEAEVKVENPRPLPAPIQNIENAQAASKPAPAQLQQVDESDDFSASFAASIRGVPSR